MSLSPEQTQTSSRTGFSTRMGFILAAAGSAVGLGNIWSFPTQVAENGGAAFVLVYFLLSLLLAYPALVAELMIGRFGQADPVTSLERLPSKPRWQKLTRLTGFAAITAICLIFSFYSIVGGWLIGFTLAPFFSFTGFTGFSQWLTSFSGSSTLFTAILFILATFAIVNAGIKTGIERWSARLMPLLVILLVLLIAAVLTRENAAVGVKHYLLPDMARIDGPLILSALGQAFFSMSLGVGAMMVYGSYLKRDASIPGVALQVCLLDTGIAFLAGLLIIPALFVASHLGVNIYLQSGQLANSDTLVFQVLPAFFSNLGSIGMLAATLFFTLMLIAALTSSISILEVPVATLCERTHCQRTRAGVVVCTFVLALTTLILLFFEVLFDAVITLTTQYAQPLLSLLFCAYAGWLMGRNRKLQEIKRGWPEVSDSLFWKIWPWHIRVVCPAMILLIIFARHF